MSQMGSFATGLGQRHVRAWSAMPPAAYDGTNGFLSLAANLPVCQGRAPLGPVRTMPPGYSEAPARRA